VTGFRIDHGETAIALTGKPKRKGELDLRLSLAVVVPDLIRQVRRADRRRFGCKRARGHSLRVERSFPGGP